MSTTAPPRVLPTLTLSERLVCYVILGTLCGVYHIALFGFPSLVYLAYTSKPVSNFGVAFRVVLGVLVVISVVPINHRPQFWFLRLKVWKLLNKYFGYETDLANITGKNKLDLKEKYLFWEAPHGIWPLGQLLSASYIPDITGVPFEEKMVCGTGASIVFLFPIIRHVFSWLGTHTASRGSFTKIFKNNNWAAVVAGGVAEMYMGSGTTEGIYVKRRFGTVKMCLQEGAHIVPSFFFGNTKAFHLIGGDSDSSLFSRVLQTLSRTLKMSIVIFSGVGGLPIPMRVPLKMTAGRVIKVKQNDNPSNEEVQAVLDQVVAEFERLYKEQKPEWETRPLVIT